MSAAEPALRPSLDPDFSPWPLLLREGGGPEVSVRVLRRGRLAGRRMVRLAGDPAESAAFWAKACQWLYGGDRVEVSGAAGLALEELYSPDGARAFDAAFFAKVYDRDASPPPADLGGHWEGCRVGFDLGASDRKCAAVKDGEVLFTEEVPWSPSAFADPVRHLEGISDSIERAARRLPRVDAIGASAAGILVGGEFRRSSLFLGLSEEDFERAGRGVFARVCERYPGAAFAAANDGAVTALAGAQQLGNFPVLGLALGSSLAAGYVDAAGRLTDTIDELAFVPLDARPDAPKDPWSGERGCAADYLSQRGAARLAEAAGFCRKGEAPAEILRNLQAAMSSGDGKARVVYENLGVYLGYALGLYALFYELKHVLLLGRLLSGPGGEIMLAKAREALAADFPALEGSVELHTAHDERGRRHGQAVAAASLPPGRERAG